MVEAIELPGEQYVLGVLWHPEEDEAEPGDRLACGRRAGPRWVRRGPIRRDRRRRARHRGGDGEVPRAGVEETDAAVARAKAAFPAWRASRPAIARALLRRLADALEERAEELATLEARNAGKPIADARGEIGMVVETYRYYAGAPERLLGKTIPVAGGVDMTFREPLGVVGLIVPWNFPLLIASWKVAPALAAGNTVVLKPAELTPLTALELERIALEAGLPEGVSTSSPARAASSAGASSSTRTWQRSPSPGRPRSGAASPRAPRRRSSG